MRSSRLPTRYGRIFPPDEAWLATAEPEVILDPELEIIDTHHHLWDLRTTSGHRYMLDEFLADANSGHTVVATVHMNAYEWDRAFGPKEMQPVGETEVAAGIAAMCDNGIYGPIRVAAGIVGFADLMLGDGVAPVLEAHVRAGGGRFRGIRHSGGWDADPIIGNSFPGIAPGLYGQPHFRAGFARLVAMGLSFDAWLYHPQLADVTDLARAFPEASIVMGHCGCPLGYGPYAGRKDEVFAAWKAPMAELATCPNVSIKLGGMMMRLAAYDYNTRPAPPTSAELASMWGPYIETCIELFGADRAMFESNFPVDRMGIGYAALWNAFKRIVSGASDGVKRGLFAGTARRVYRLD
ncbi:amidohydrolase family protein [Mesorhizobium sp. M7A.F.Ca.CA.001.05.1.1]|uniref:amidohydrolase family protein n=1 Tax=Mesorhizobium sp. M7A.F.Ca.CA.001.05.1.1 TaxID=2496721 RepID=UPI000FCBDECA|nr:amidohydrolase family protein [Mesorhizobium sp. M7A.F.Ca.CA.001.05.1.1]RUY69439.1 amidohydrolase [Mesorhizobium sp. M7A.F.Ca.CA.001.05.1.1]